MEYLPRDFQPQNAGLVCDTPYMRTLGKVEYEQIAGLLINLGQREGNSWRAVQPEQFNRNALRNAVPGMIREGYLVQQPDRRVMLSANALERIAERYRVRA